MGSGCLASPKCAYGSPIRKQLTRWTNAQDLESILPAKGRPTPFGFRLRPRHDPSPDAPVARSVPPTPCSAQWRRAFIPTLWPAPHIAEPCSCYGPSSGRCRSCFPAVPAAAEPAESPTWPPLDIPSLVHLQEMGRREDGWSGLGGGGSSS